MDGVIERRQADHNNRIHQAHFTAQFMRAKELPHYQDFYVDVGIEYVRGRTNEVKDDPDESLRAWALVFATDEQRKQLCH